MAEDNKNIVSIRIADSARQGLQKIATRLLVREAVLYRLAIQSLLTKMQAFQEPDIEGIDLLPFFLEMREELLMEIKLKKEQLYTIFNHNVASSDKYISMSDIELLLLPPPALRRRLYEIQRPPDKNIDTNTWLKLYLTEKYSLADNPAEQTTLKESTKHS